MCIHVFRRGSGLLYYYTFYRVLFESIRSISEFALFQFVHLASEWLLYTIRSSQWYYGITDKLMRQCVPLKWCLSEQRLSLSHWQEFIAMDFGIRCSIFVSTGYGILLLLITIQFVPWYLGIRALVSVLCFVILVWCLSLFAFIEIKIYFISITAGCMDVFACSFITIYVNSIK